MAGIIRCRELCLSDFGIHKVCYHGGITYDATKGKQQTNIGYLRRGSCVFSTPFADADCRAGDLIYLPEGTRYSSVSRGEPQSRTAQSNAASMPSNAPRRQTDLKMISMLIP